MGNDHRVGKPFVAAHVIEMPMGVQHILGRAVAESLQRLGQLFRKAFQLVVDDQQAVGAGQDRDVTARKTAHAHQHGDLAGHGNGADGDIGGLGLGDLMGMAMPCSGQGRAGI